MSLYVVQLRLGPIENFVYLVGSETTRRAVVVDPAWEVESALARAAEDGMTLVGGLVSHTHPDHINAAMRVDAPMHVHALEAERVRELGADVVPRKSGDVLELGPDCHITFVHTPGHTPGSQSFLLRGPGANGEAMEALVSGDTLFVNGCGRCDLPGGDPEQMFRTIDRTLRAMPDGTRLYPGHDYADRKVSTLGDEKRQNPYFQYHDLAAFVAYRMRPRR
jgi:glyoxylase-like metal-dependent hydrolase (beta-lactamase superfamily II)